MIIEKVVCMDYDLFGNKINIEFNSNDLWVGMPFFNQEKKVPFKVCEIIIGEEHLFVRFDTEKDVRNFKNNNQVIFIHDKFYLNSREELAIVAKQNITKSTKSIWYPYKSHWGNVKYKYISDDNKQPRYPVYIVSKGRWKNGLTTKALNKMGIEHYIVVEANEYELYSANTKATVLILPQNYLDGYNTCDDLGSTKSKGPGAARNFCIDHSSVNGYKRHWVLDDNLDAFHYLTNNEKLECETSATFRASEDFVDRFTNVPVSGMNYYSFCKTTDKVPPFTINTRIYSCLLIENAAGYRWRGRYNEDTDLSLRVLKDGLCTIQFNAFLCGKVTTQRMAGGNTKEFYASEGTLPKSKMLVDLHPDVSKVVWRFNRWHHYVAYNKFKDNRLSTMIYNGNNQVNSYGLRKVIKEQL